MTAILKMNIQELDSKFVEDLKHQFAHSEVEIRVHELPATQPTFTTKDFWSMIAQLDWSFEGDDEAVVEPVIQLLEKRPLSHIYRFEDILAEKIWHLDTKNHAQIFLDDTDDDDDNLSVDDFLYTRCAVVANGKGFYDKVLNNPEKMPEDLTFEPLLYIAMTAYERKTGKEFMFAPVFDYETYSNKEGWKDKTL